jgi:hypothetical protein
MFILSFSECIKMLALSRSIKFRFSSLDCLCAIPYVGQVQVGRCLGISEFCHVYRSRQAWAHSAEVSVPRLKSVETSQPSSEWSPYVSVFLRSVMQYTFWESVIDHPIQVDYILILIVGGGVQIASTRYVGYFWPVVPSPGDCEDGKFGGMKTGRGNRSTRRKPAPAPLCPPQIPLDQTRARTRAAAMGSQRLTAWAMARSLIHLCWE